MMWKLQDTVYVLNTDKRLLTPSADVNSNKLVITYHYATI